MFLAYHEAVPKRFHDLRGFSRNLQRLLPKLAKLITQKYTGALNVTAIKLQDENN